MHRLRCSGIFLIIWCISAEHYLYSYNFELCIRSCIYWMEIKTCINFGSYLHQGWFVYVYESLFEMLNIHIWAHCHTFHCKQTKCVPHVNDYDRSNESEIKAVYNNTLLRTRPDGIAIFPGVCTGFALVVQVLSWSKQRNFQIYMEKHNFLGRTSTDSKYNTLL